MRRFCLYGTSAVVWTQNCPPMRLVATRWCIALRARNESTASAESATGLASLRGASQQSERCPSTSKTPTTLT